MVQPKYNPKEALERIKLMMEYDSSKTLSENVEVINEQDTATKTAISTGVAAGTGAAVAGGAAAANVATTTALGSGAYSAMGLGASLGVESAVGAAALGGAVFAGAAALALTPLVIWYMDKDNAKPKVERIIKYCVSDKDKISKVPREVQDTTIRDLSDKLYDAMEGAGTNEESVYSVFKSLKTASDFCALVDRFNKDYGSKGDLIEWLDDDFDATSEWEQIYRPIRNVVEDTLLTIKDETIEDKCKTNPNDPDCKKTIKKDNNNGGRVIKKVTYTTPTELKDVSGVQKFQDWLDKTHPGWHDKYNTLGGIVSRGYGTFGPRTNKAWNSYKTEYLGGTSVTTNPFAKDTKVSSDDPNNI
jgi:hypothetical protein